VPTGRPAVAFAIWVVFTCGALACARDPATDVLDSERGAVLSWLESATVRFVSAPERTKSGWRKTISWRAESALSWEELVGRLTPQPPTGFRGCEAREGHVVCTRRIAGDTIQVVVEPDKAQPRPNLRVILTADAS
jgi:hypothetical protein